jgi:hypothetical protein
MTDESDFAPGDVVLDRDDDEADPALVVNCIPGATADEWDVPGDQTVAEANPDYPADASVIAVVFEAKFDDDALEWNREEPIAFTELNDSPMKCYAFPAPRLVRDEQRSHGAETAESPDESVSPTLTDIQHVGDGRADDLREAGYESVEAVVTTDQRTLADIDGIGETRAAQITASAADLLDEQSDASEADTADEPEPDTTESRETPEADTAPSAALVALQRYLKSDGMSAGIADDGQSVRVTNADDSYRVSLDGVEGDGPQRSQLEEAVEKVRAATEAPTE